MIISTINSKGGVGKTTLAVHLAHWLFLHGWSVVFVDCDAQRLSSSWLRTAAPELETVILASPDQIAKQLPKLGKQFDAVVVDAPGGLGDIGGAILSVTTAALIPTRPSNLDIMALEWAIKTVKEIQKLREGLPQTVIVPFQAAQNRRTTRHLMQRAKSLGFGITQTTVPHREIYGKSAGLEDQLPELIWNKGRSKEVRQAALELDELFQEVFPEACESNPMKIRRMVTPKKLMTEFGETIDEKRTANG